MSVSASPKSPLSPGKEVRLSLQYFLARVDLLCGSCSPHPPTAKCQTAEALVEQVRVSEETIRDIDRQISLLMVRIFLPVTLLAATQSRQCVKHSTRCFQLLTSTMVSQEEREVHEKAKARLQQKLAKFETFDLEIRVRGAVITGKQEHHLDVNPNDSIRDVKEALCLSMQAMHRKKHGNEEVCATPLSRH